MVVEAPWRLRRRSGVRSEPATQSACRPQGADIDAVPVRDRLVAEAVHERSLRVVERNQRLDRGGDRDLGGARVVAVVDLERDTEPALRQRRAVDAFGADLAEDAL